MTYVIINNVCQMKVTASFHDPGFLWFSSLYIFSIGDLPFPIMNSFLHSQKPSLYQSLVYADLAHSTTSNTGPVKRKFPTVHVDILCQDRRKLKITRGTFGSEIGAECNVAT